MLLYLLAGLVCAVIAAVVAHGKGRNSLGWFIAGLVIGPFALVVTFLPATVRTGRFVACPACREIVHADANVCRYCHLALDTAAGEQ